jgi:4-hydroxybenzoate polyprenyltransferase
MSAESESRARSVEPAGTAPLPRTLVATRGWPATARAAFEALRPAQWSKNGLVLLALIFSRRLTDPSAIGRVLVAFVAFCFASSTVYILNDIADRRRDRRHPTKRLRPIASGRLALPVAVALAAICAALALALAGWLALVILPHQPDPYLQWGGASLLLIAIILGYLLLNVAYSWRLKRIPLWDVFIIAAGFVLRALAGALAIPVPISPWFYLCTTFLALLLALGKRRAELVSLAGGRDTGQRESLRAYSVALLDQLLAVVVTCALITYSLYTFENGTAGHALMITIPFVIFGIFRYLYLLYVKGQGEHPDEILWRDGQILGSVALCLGTVMLLLYVIPR